MTNPATTPLTTRGFDLVALGLAAVLALHAPHLPWWLGATLAPILGLRWWLRRQRQVRAPVWLKLPLLAALLLAIVSWYGNLFGQAPGAALAVGLLVLKLLETETVRDARVGASFTCFTLMAALLFDQSLTATTTVALGLLPPLAALRALEPGRRQPARLWRELLPGLGLLAVALPLALLGFLLLPRLSSPLWGAPNAGEQRTGLSDRMTPAGFTQLLVDDSPALRVSFDGQLPPPDQRYFRAYVMEHYDGSSWTYRDAARQRPAPVEAGQVIRYHVSLEPTRQRVLPTLDVPLAAPPGASLRRDREVIADHPVDNLRDYTLESATRYRLEPQLGRYRARWLQLPAGFDPRTLALGRSWRARYGGDNAAIVHAALALFHDGGFRYTLAPAPLGRDAMDDFLFDTREGFCEHYASAFTVLMRAAGIPARVVTGYQGGYWNALGRYLLVRNSDAHAWSEVWLDGRGWVRVDPTAAVRPQRISRGAAAAVAGQLPWYQSGWLQSLRNHWDIVNRWWNLGVNGFDALRQRGLLKPFGIREADTSTLALLLAIGCVLAMAAGLAWVWRRREPEDAARAALRRLERKLARLGVARQAGEGPRDYLQRAARALPAQHDTLIQLMHHYLELRYAHSEPTSESLRALRRAVRDFPAVRMVK
ncbi:transglutaminase TgpA family protein [Rhodanobacter aciditrophus]|uniref:transglutaminase TgpA family protein n=1 Tax=Rhodanobacter aciditrophus TaxID=1623218 RepID=UPI003CF6398A